MITLSLLLVNAGNPAPTVKAGLARPFCALHPQLCTETAEP
jgi:hypothetical protein